MKKAVCVIEKDCEIMGVIHKLRISFRRRTGFVMRLSTKDQKTLLLSAPRSAIRNMEEVDKLIPSLAETILDKYKKGFPCHLETEISKIYDGTNLLILGKKEEVGALSPEEVEKVLKEKGYAYYADRVQVWARKMRIPYPLTFRIRTMTTRFGVNSIARHVITFSTIAICYSPEIVDYLIVHELAHCFVRGHQKDFYAIVNKYDPQYKIHSKKLKKGIYV